jgi:hypothetical protein
MREAGEDDLLENSRLGGDGRGNARLGVARTGWSTSC